MSLFIEMHRNGHAIATGTGIIGLSPSGRPALLTNWHNVTGKRPDTGALLDERGGRVPDELRILHLAALPGSDIGWVQQSERLYNDDQTPRWLEHPIHGNKVDAVALPLGELDGVRLLPYLGPSVAQPSIAFGPADVVSVIGFPFGLTGGGGMAIWATGFVASEPQVDQDGLPLFLVDCRARQGQSGSAVIAFRSGGGVAMENGDTSFFDGPVWRFLGLYSGRINRESDLGLVWKASALMEILSSVA